MIRISGVSNENTTSAFCGKIVLCNTDVSTPSGVIVKDWLAVTASHRFDRGLEGLRGRAELVTNTPHLAPQISSGGVETSVLQNAIFPGKANVVF